VAERIRSADGCEIAYEASGTGPALVIVNGAFGTRGTGAAVAAALESLADVGEALAPEAIAGGVPACRRAG
jgi:hypothetical protein